MRHTDQIYITPLCTVQVTLISWVDFRVLHVFGRIFCIGIGKTVVQWHFDVSFPFHCIAHAGLTAGAGPAELGVQGHSCIGPKSKIPPKKTLKKLVKLTGHTYACNSLTDFAFQALVMNKNENYGNLLAHCLKKKLSNHLIQRHSQAKKQNSVIKQILKTREIDSSYVLMLATVWQILHFKHLQWTETEIMGICWNSLEELIVKSLKIHVNNIF